MTLTCHRCTRVLDENWEHCPQCGTRATGAKLRVRFIDKGSGSPDALAPGYGPGVRRQVFEVIVRQAINGAPWREICVGPMQVNQITEAEVEAEVRRRTDDDGMQPTCVPKTPKQPDDVTSNKLALPPGECGQPESGADS